MTEQAPKAPRAARKPVKKSLIEIMLERAAKAFKTKETFNIVKGKQVIPALADELKWFEHELVTEAYRIRKSQVDFNEQCESDFLELLKNGLAKHNELSGNDSLNLNEFFYFTDKDGLITLSSAKNQKPVATKSLITARNLFYAMIDKYELEKKPEIAPFIENNKKMFDALDNSITPDVSAILELANSNFPEEIYPEWVEIRMNLKDGYKKEDFQRRIQVSKRNSFAEKAQVVSIYTKA